MTSVERTVCRAHISPRAMAAMREAECLVGMGDCWIVLSFVVWFDVFVRGMGVRMSGGDFLLEGGGLLKGSGHGVEVVTR